LQRVLEAESVPSEDGALRLLARAARGSMRDGLSLTDQAIAYGGGQLTEAGVRSMLGSVDRSHARTLVDALSRHDGAAVLAAVDSLRSLGLSASATLEELALLLQQMAVEQAVPGALDAEDADTEAARSLLGVLAADELQLLYSMVLHGREELSLMNDEYGALTMVLLRFLAFPAQGAATAPREVRSAPLRAPAPPAISVAKVQPSVKEVPLPATAVAVSPAMAERVSATGSVPDAAAVATAHEPSPFDGALADRWNTTFKALCEQGSVAALVRELAAQAGLVAIDESATPHRWKLQVAREPLRNPALADKLAAALSVLLGHAVVLDIEAGNPSDSPAQRDAAERARRQAAAEATIEQDPVVRELMQQFKTARIVPGSIKPL
ncbi:MAG: DNA polymerase III subunit gamma/tau, partial [Rubrivivax sp.]|nr:DNA polymerase III subunit gamma/tau [Rubrivivax sp.]